MKIIKLLPITILVFYSCKRNELNKENKSTQNKSKKEAITKNTLEKENTFKEGDLIFQITKNGQSHAIQFLTKSNYSHVGVILKREEELLVYEASSKVRFTPLNKFIENGVNKHFVVKRLINSKDILSKQAISKMKLKGLEFHKRSYDLCFEWSDDYIYCSELVWKIYKESLNIEIGKPKPLSVYDLGYSPAQKIIKKRKKENKCKFKSHELVISPADMFHSKLLKTIQIDQ